MQAEQQCQPQMCLLWLCPVFSQKPDRVGPRLVMSSQVLLTVPMCEHLLGGQPVCRSDLAHGSTSEHGGSLWGPCSHLRNLAPSLWALQRAHRRVMGKQGGLGEVGGPWGGGSWQGAVTGGEDGPLMRLGSVGLPRGHWLQEGAAVAEHLDRGPQQSARRGSVGGCFQGRADRFP